MKFIHLLLIFIPFNLLIAQSSEEYLCYPKDPKARYREHNYDMLKGIIDLKFDAKASKVIGKVTYTFKPKQQSIDTMYLDAPCEIFSSITLDGKEIKYTTYKDLGISLQLGKSLAWDTEHTLVLNYTCEPRKGIYFLGWNDEKNLMRKQIWTQGQGVDNRYWIPGYDDVSDKLFTETIITFDKTYEVVSNGDLKSVKENTDGTKTWHYAMNHPQVLYLVMLAIDKYAYKDIMSKNSLRIRQYYYGDRPETFEPTYQYSKEMMDWQEEELNMKFPWNTYANCPVQDFMYGAMENTTATIFTDYYVQDKRGALERNYIGVNCHEQTHQWFGDYVTEISSTHHWLHESFATHYAKHFRRFIFGEDEYQWIRRDEMRQAWEADKSNHLPIAHSGAGSTRHYPQGSIVLDMLRYVVGNEQYRKVITEYLKEHPYELVESNDLYRAFYDVLGINLDWFFDEWVYRGGIPKYEVSYKDDSSLFEMSVAQTHAQDATKGLFRMPIPIHVYYTDGSIDSFMIPNESFTTKTFYWEKSGVAKKVSFVLFDPNWNVLKTVVFNKSYEELIAQATSAKNMIDRYDAIIELKNIDIEKKRNDLIKLYNKESFYGLQTEIVSQLANDKNKSSQELLIKATTNKNHLVRRATIEGVIELQKPLQKQYELLLKDSSYVTIEIALNKLCSTYPNNVKKYLELTKNEIGMNKNIRIAWLSNACKYIDKNTYKNELIDYSSHSYEFRTRTKAFNAIENLELFDETIANNLMNAMCSSNARLANPAISVLRKLISSNTDNKVIAKKILETKTWKDWQKEILSKEIN